MVVRIFRTIPKIASAKDYEKLMLEEWMPILISNLLEKCGYKCRGNSPTKSFLR